MYTMFSFNCIGLQNLCSFLTTLFVSGVLTIYFIRLCFHFVMYFQICFFFILRYFFCILIPYFYISFLPLFFLYTTILWVGVPQCVKRLTRGWMTRIQFPTGRIICLLSTLSKQGLGSSRPLCVQCRWWKIETDESLPSNDAKFKRLGASFLILHAFHFVLLMRCVFL